MIFPLEITASGEKFVSCVVSSEEYYCLNFAIYCVCWCYFYTVKQQPCRRINNLIIKYSTALRKKKTRKLLKRFSLRFYQPDLHDLLMLEPRGWNQMCWVCSNHSPSSGAEGRVSGWNEPVRLLTARRSRAKLWRKPLHCPSLGVSKLFSVEQSLEVQGKKEFFGQ